MCARCEAKARLGTTHLSDAAYAHLKVRDVKHRTRFGRSTDEASPVETTRAEVARYGGLNYTAEREGEDLVVFVSGPTADPGTSYGASVNDGQVNKDFGLVARINAANKKYWSKEMPNERRF